MYKQFKKNLFIFLAIIGIVPLFATTAFALAAKLLHEFPTHHMVTEAVKVGDKIFAGVRTSRLNVFDLTGKTQPSEILLPVKSGAWGPLPVSLFSIDSSPDQQILAVASNHGKLLLYQPATLKLSRSLNFQGIDSLTAVRFVDNERVLFGTMGGEIVLSKINGSVIYQRPIEYDAISRLTLSPNKTQFAVATNASVIRIFETSSGNLVKELKGHKDSVYDLGFIDEQVLISGGKDRRLLAWDLGNGKFSELYQSESYIHSLAINKTRDLIAFPVEDHQIGIMSWPKAKIQKRISGHRAFVHTLRFVDSRNILLSGGNDSRVKMFKMED